MDSTIKATILIALERSRGDDLARARMAFRNFSDAQMQEKCSVSGQTYQQLLDGYIRLENNINAAVAWVKAQ